MKEKIEKLLVEIKQLRTEAFQQGNEQMHMHLGRAFSSLLRVKELFQ